VSNVSETSECQTVNLCAGQKQQTFIILVRRRYCDPSRLLVAFVGWFVSS